MDFSLKVFSSCLLFGSAHRVPFHSGGQRQRKPFSKSVQVPLFKHGFDAHSSNSNNDKFRRVILVEKQSYQTTLITSRSDETRIAFTSKRIGIIRNASTMLITNIRRAYYISKAFNKSIYLLYNLPSDIVK